MKISFVIPAHNEENDIVACLESIKAEVARTGTDAELIVVNNASTDHTKERAASVPGVRVVDEPRKGLPFARDAGLWAASGDLIANIDADNLMPKGWLDIVMTEFSTQSIVGLSGPYVYHDLPFFGRLLTRALEGPGFLFYLFTHYVRGRDAMVCGGNFVVRRSALEAIGGFDTSIGFWGEDTATMHRLEKVGIVKWNWHFRILASGRRFEKEGIFRRTWLDIVSYVSITLREKPVNFHAEDVRI